LNNPLTVITTFPDLIASSAGKRLKADESEDLQEIKSAGARMQKIVQDLLTFSRPSGREKKGEGMAADVVKKIFDPFFTLKETGKGTRLGLSIVHGIVAEHGGRIEVHSSPLEGTEFVLTFPAGRDK